MHAIARLTIAACVLSPFHASAEDKALPDFDKLWKYHEPIATRAAFEKILKQTEKSAPASYRLQLLTQIARTHSLAGTFTEAHAILDRVAQELAGDTGAGQTLARVRYLLERGRTFRSAKKVNESRPLFSKAYKLSVASKLDYFAIDAAHMMALAVDADQKMAWNEKALAIVDKTQDKRAQGWRATLYNNIGWDYHDRKEYAKALVLLRKSLATWKARRPDSEGARTAEWSVAKQLRCLGKASEALAIQIKLLPLHEKAGESPGFVHEEIGECLLLLKRPEDAKPHFAKAHAMLAKFSWVAEDKERMARLRRLAGP